MNENGEGEKSSNGEDPALVVQLSSGQEETGSSPLLAALLEQLHPLFAGSGGIDSWLGSETPNTVIDRLSTIDDDPLSHAQLAQLLILSHEAGPSQGFFDYYWMSAPSHTYDVKQVDNASFQDAWISGTSIVSISHLRWGLYRFYVDALLYFGNIRSAYRKLRELTIDEIHDLFQTKRIDTTSMLSRGPILSIEDISLDNRYLVAEQACKSLELREGTSAFEDFMIERYRQRISRGDSPIATIDEIIHDKTTPGDGRQQQFIFSADEILEKTISSEEELRTNLQDLSVRFHKVRNAALRNTELYLSMVHDLDIYVATSMRSRGDFRKVGNFTRDLFRHADLSDMNLRYFDPTLSAATGHVDKGLIECLMVDAAKMLIYIAGDRDSLGKDFEAAMALSRGKPVIVYCDNDERFRMYQDVHPLARLVEFETGVTIGALVASDVEVVRKLILNFFTNSMEYELQAPHYGGLHLLEKNSSSLVRFQTHDRLLQEAFWNYYHRLGIWK